MHNWLDLDKPYIKNMLEIFDPSNLWTADYTADWLTLQAKNTFIPRAQFEAEIEEYTDGIGKKIEKHDSLYTVKYDHDSKTHTMHITNTATLEVSIFKRWLNFEKEEMPESIWLMLVSKVQEDYAEAAGVEEFNIYTPVATVLYGDQISLASIPGGEDGLFNDAVTQGIEKLLGKGFLSAVAGGVVDFFVKKYTATGVAIAEVDDDVNNPLTEWWAWMGVKKYGAYGVPMDFAGTELTTGLMELVIDAIIRYLGIPKIHCPVMYDPINECWSIKGYGICYPGIDEDYELTCNVFNIKFHSGDAPDSISGKKLWEDNDNADDTRPDEIKIHVYVKDDNGDRKEITGSPVTVTADDNWEWSLEIPLNDVSDVKEDGENSSVTYKSLDDFEIEEEVPDGYSAQYSESGFDVTNTYTGKKEVSGCKIWDDDSDADGVRPGSITIRLLADGEEVDSKTVTKDDDWKWKFEDLPLVNEEGEEIEYTISEDAVENYTAKVEGFNVTNTHTPQTVVPETVDISGSKVWNDNDNKYSTRPASIEIYLLADGIVAASRTVSAAGSWSWSFTGMQKYRDDGTTPISYSFSEEPVAGYETSYSGLVVTNTLITIDIAGRKTWVGDTEADRPESITVRLWADGREVDSRTLTSGDDWSWSFTGLPKYAGEHEIVYTLTEDSVDGYVAEINGYNITNQPAQESELVIVNTVTGYDTTDNFLFEIEKLNVAGAVDTSFRKLTVMISGTGSVTVNCVMPGQYRVTELTGWSWRYDIETSEQVVITVPNGGTATAAFRNKLGDKNWLQGETSDRATPAADNTSVDDPGKAHEHQGIRKPGNGKGLLT